MQFTVFTVNISLIKEYVL